SLDAYIKHTSGPIPETKALFFFNQVLDGLSYAHKRDVIHRDIKPSNIMITSEADVKILDFGIAKILKSNLGGLTKTGTQPGTVLYMSPEQVRGESIDQRSDIYSLGLTFFEMLTGQCPYDPNTDSDFKIFEKILNEPLPLAQNIYPAVSDKMQAIIDKATAKNPAERFQSCEEFKIALSPETRVRTQTEFVSTQQSNPTTPVSASSKQPEQKRERSFLLLYLLIGTVLIASFFVIYNEFRKMTRGNSEGELTEVIDNPATNDPDEAQEEEDVDEDEIEDLEEALEEVSVEQLLLDSLKANEDRVKDDIKLLEEQRNNDLLKGLLIDSQLESSDFGEYIVRITVANQRDDAKFEEVVISVTFFDESGNEITVVEQELEPVEPEQTITFRVTKDMPEGARFESALKNAKPIDLDVPPTLDSLQNVMQDLMDQIRDLQERVEDEGEII
ncbi:MAG: protein kinase, partial [Bacteroidota bacterium]